MRLAEVQIPHWHPDSILTDSLTNAYSILFSSLLILFSVLNQNFPTPSTLLFPYPTPTSIKLKQASFGSTQQWNDLSLCAHPPYPLPECRSKRERRNTLDCSCLQFRLSLVWQEEVKKCLMVICILASLNWLLWHLGV